MVHVKQTRRREVLQSQKKKENKNKNKRKVFLEYINAKSLKTLIRCWIKNSAYIPNKTYIIFHFFVLYNNARLVKNPKKGD